MKPLLRVGGVTVLPTTEVAGYGNVVVVSGISYH
jgi:hypothetical protein